MSDGADKHFSMSRTDEVEGAQMRNRPGASAATLTSSVARQDVR